MATRRRTPSDQLEPAILEAAESILEEEGPDALSVRRISERAGVAPMGLYSRFDGKLGVVDELFKEGFNELAATIRRACDTADDPVVGFREAGLAYRALALAHPSRYRVMFDRPVVGYEPSEEAVVVATASFGTLVEAVTRCIDAERFTLVDPVIAAQQVWSACHGWVALELQGICFCDDPDAGYAGLLDVLERGLAMSR
jgi:AcrR family transcriptional regulator